MSHLDIPRCPAALGIPDSETRVLYTVKSAQLGQPSYSPGPQSAEKGFHLPTARSELISVREKERTVPLKLWKGYAAHVALFLHDLF